MPNALAYLAIFLSIPLGIGMFFMLRPPVATLVVFLGAILFLPEKTALDLPGLPGVGKLEAASIACLLGAMLRARRRLRDAKMFRGPDRWVLLFMAGALGTSLTNTDVLVYGVVVLPALTVREAFSVAFLDFLIVLLPFFLGRAMFNSAKDLRTALTGVVLAAVIYTPFMFIEIMLSPQLHNWIYGFHQHSFAQALRGGGYRPLVFMEHGLAASMLLVLGLLSAMTLHKARKSVMMVPAALATGYLAVFMLAVKSLGAALYAFSVSPLVALLRPRALVRLAVILAIIVFSYPALRAYDIFPDKALVSLAYAASGDRASSLEYRFNMENTLAAHASKRPWFGWGRFDRNALFDEYGRPATVSDGMWIILYGIRGIVGFIAFFAYLLSPIFLLRKRLPRVQGREEQTLLAGLAIVLAVSAVDLLPNGLFNTIPLFLAGILYGTTKALSSLPPSTAPDAIPVVKRVT
jgi:hypothetical protein